MQTFTTENPLFRLAPEIAEELRKNFRRDAGVNVYLRDEIPEELHWRQNPYCPPILVLADVGTVILRSGPQLQKPVEGSRQSRMNSPGVSRTDADRLDEMLTRGLSGYDPEEPDMRGVFMARGPGMRVYFPIGPA